MDREKIYEITHVKDELLCECDHFTHTQSRNKCIYKPHLHRFVGRFIEVDWHRRLGLHHCGKHLHCNLQLWWHGERYRAKNSLTKLFSSNLLFNFVSISIIVVGIGCIKVGVYARQETWRQLSHLNEIMKCVRAIHDSTSVFAVIDSDYSSIVFADIEEGAEVK